MTRLHLRVDGSTSIGLGHVGRCIAVAQEARERGWNVGFVLGPASHSSTARFIDRHGFKTRTVLSPAEETSWLRGVAPGDTVVLDGYHLDHARLVEATAELQIRIAVIDDRPEANPIGDVYCNPNPQGAQEVKVPNGTTLLSGPRYALLRREITMRRPEIDLREPHRLLLTFGGSDPKGLGPIISSELQGLPHFPDRVLLQGPTTTHWDCPYPDTVIVRNPKDLGTVLLSTDGAVSAAGTTTWELLCLGVPAAFVEVADNQRLVGPAVEAAEAGLFLGRPTDAILRLPATLTALADPQTRRALHEAAKEMVDGQGVRRLLDALTP